MDPMATGGDTFKPFSAKTLVFKKKNIENTEKPCMLNFPVLSQMHHCHDHVLVRHIRSHKKELGALVAVHLSQSRDTPVVPLTPCTLWTIPFRSQSPKGSVQSKRKWKVLANCGFTVVHVDLRCLGLCINSMFCGVLLQS